MGKLVFRVVDNSACTPGNAAITGSWVAGKLGTWALEFDGSNDYVSSSWNSSTDFNYDDAFSVSAWVKPRNLASGDAYPPIVAKERYPGPTQRGWNCALQNTGEIWWGMIADNGSKGYLWKYTAAGSVTDDTWYHIVWTYDGSNSQAGQKIYVDGTVRSTTDGPDTAFVSGYNIDGWPLSLGTRGTGEGYWFDGNLDEVSIYNTDLDSGAVSDLYNSGAALAATNVSSSALVVYFNMENGPGNSTLTDRSSNTAIGSLIGMNTGSCD